MGIEEKCGLEHCQEQPISVFCVYGDRGLKDHKFSCLAHENVIRGLLREKYPTGKYSLTILDITQIKK